MKKKIKNRFILLSITSIFFTTVVLSFAFYNFLKKQVFENLKNYSEVVYKIIQKSPDLSIFSSLPASDIRITYILNDGTVVFDSDSWAETLENHLSRPEISEALKNGSGNIIRRSNTLSESLFYYAVLLEDGNLLRVGKRASNIFAIFLSILPAVVCTFCVLFALSVIFSHFLTKEIIKPIENMADSLDSVNINPGYPELIPFANKIRSQHDTILSTVNMRQDFTANVSHELKTPLTAISGYAELIENNVSESTGGDTRHFACEIHKNSDRLLSLINDILRLSELDSMPKAYAFSDEKWDFSAVIQEILENLGLEAEKNDIKLIYKGPDSLDFTFSKEMMQELCFNLVSNAIRYNKKGGKVKVILEDNPVSLTVEDTGIGIPLEAQDRIFERFYRVDKSRSKEVGGTGLGLAIVKHIAEIAGAKITLESKLGIGTKIKVLFVGS